MNEIEFVEDARLGPLRKGSECLVCGKKINIGGCYVESPKTGNIKVTAHISCVNGMDAFELAAKYQIACTAIVSGKKERPMT